MVNHISDKTSILEEILKIENEINLLRKDSTYMKIARTQRKIEVRKRSKKMNSIKERYQEQLLGFDEKLGSLRRDRKNLVKQLFG
jgi:lipid II:glycine glycyltransferase (peptidoglycan interpeptide bridge formation enzyme)